MPKKNKDNFWTNVNDVDYIAKNFKPSDFDEEELRKLTPSQRANLSKASKDWKEVMNALGEEELYTKDNLNSTKAPTSKKEINDAFKKEYDSESVAKAKAVDKQAKIHGMETNADKREKRLGRALSPEDRLKANGASYTADFNDPMIKNAEINNVSNNDVLTNQKVEKDDNKGTTNLNYSPKLNNSVTNPDAPIPSNKSDIKKEERIDEEKIKEAEKVVTELENNDEIPEEEKRGLDKFLDALKSGKMDVYPALKALGDSMANYSQMLADRINIINGQASDTSIYKGIETETDKERDLQRQDRADVGVSKEEALNAANNGDFESLGNLIAIGSISYEDALNGLQGTNAKAFEERYGYLATKEKNEAEQSTIETAQKKQEYVQVYQDNIQKIDNQITSLEELKTSLAGNDWEAYEKAANAYLGIRRGISSYTEQTSAQQSQGLTDAPIGFNLSGFGFGGSMTGSDTYVDESSSGSGNAITKDQYAEAGLATADQYAKQSMADKNEANEKLINRIDNQIGQLQELKQYNIDKLNELK